MSATRLLWDRDGASLVEFTIVIPVLFVLTLGTIDLGYMLYDYDVASKAAYAGAHRAVVSDPVATEIVSPTWTASDIGTDCATSSVCTTYVTSATCTKASSSGSCTGSYTFDDNAFTAIVNKMQTAFGCTAGSNTCALQAKNVSITYAVNGTLGFVGEPNGLPMNVTVKVTCLNHPFYFIGSLMGWTFTTRQGCTGPASGWYVPAYSTTLTSEDLATN